MLWPVAKEISFKDIYIFSSGGHFVQLSFLSNLSGGFDKDHFCEIILNLDQWFRRCSLKIFHI